MCNSLWVVTKNIIFFVATLYLKGGENNKYVEKYNF